MNTQLWLRSLAVVARFKDVPVEQLQVLSWVFAPVIYGTTDNALITAQLDRLKSVRSMDDRSAFIKIQKSAMATDIVAVNDINYHVAGYRVNDERGIRLAIYGAGLPSLFFRVAEDSAKLKTFMSNPKITPKSLTRFQDGEDLWDVLAYTNENSTLPRYMVIFCENGSANPAEYSMPITVVKLDSDEPVAGVGRTSHFTR